MTLGSDQPLNRNEYRRVALSTVPYRLQVSTVLKSWSLKLPQPSGPIHCFTYLISCRLSLKCDGTRAETRFRLSAKRTSPFKLPPGRRGASVQSTAGSRGVCISGSNAGYTVFRGSVKGTGFSLHSPVSPALPRPCVAVCHSISTGVYNKSMTLRRKN